MEQRRSALQKTKFSEVQPNKTQKLAISISNILCHHSKKESVVTKKHLDRYLYTFSIEVGADLPSDQILRNIYLLLVGASDNLEDTIKEENFTKVVEVCLNIYKQSKKTAIGGIFQRVVMGLKQALYYSKLQAVAEQAS